MNEDVFFDRNRSRARAIMVDSESKVVKQLLTSEVM